MNKKAIQLIEKMIEEDDYQTVSFFALGLNVSTRTIFNYLEFIEEELKDSDLYVHKVQGRGIRLIGSQKDKIDLLHSLNGVEVLSTLERQLIIIQKLILEEQTLTYQKLSDYFMVSTSSITKDLEKIQHFFKKYSIQLVSDKKGTYVIGDEYHKQLCQVTYLEERLSLKKKRSEDTLQKEDLSLLKLFIEGEIVDGVYQIFHEFIGEYQLHVSHKYSRRMFITLIVFISRLKYGKHPYIEKDFLFEEMKYLDSYILAEELLKRICSQFQIVYESQDVDYINKQLMALKIKIKEVPVNPIYLSSIQELINQLSEILKVNLNQDQKLLKSLLFHFTPMIYRLRMNANIKNPLLHEIQTQYSILFSIIAHSVYKIESQYQVILTEDEIAFLTVYFQVALERNKGGKKILIVCLSGIGTSELIFHKIQKAIPAQDTLEITTYHALKKRDLRKIDLIISTIDLDIEDIPIIKVSALISNSDLKKITEKYANFFYKDDYEREIEHFQYLKQYIEEKMIFWDMEFKNKDECLKFVMEKLYSAGYVKEGFEKSILEREKIGTTALDSGVAIPHASIEYTRETKIVIVNLKHKILWNDKKIAVVALININQKDKANVRNLLGELYQFIRERKDVEKYFKMNTKDEFIKSINQ